MTDNPTLGAEPTTSAELTCQELVELVTDYLEGAMADHTRTRFEAHIDECLLCRRYLDQMRRTIVYVGKLSEADLTQEAQRELLHAFRRWKNA